MAEPDKPLLIKRYASRRLYNTETSDYVTLEDIAGFIRAGPRGADHRPEVRG
jgi:polyhydroxyalkanoate synthesis regulator protein